MMLSIVETMAVEMLGEDAAMTMGEKLLLSTSLRQALSSKTNVAALERLTPFVWPALLVAGSTFYAARLARLMAARRVLEEAPQVSVMDTPEQPPAPPAEDNVNGHREVLPTWDFNQVLKQIQVPA